MFHIVLFEPQIPPNTGNAIRLGANLGATLHLIKPLGFCLDDRSLRRSSLDYHDLAAVKVHADLDACIRDLPDSRLFAVETSGARCYGEARYRGGDAFLFGPETRGLPAAVLARIGAGQTLYIPMQSATRSINLSNAVAIVLYEAWRQQNFAAG